MGKTENVPQDRKGKVVKKSTQTTRRVRGKLSKQEQQRTKATHRDISHLLAQKPSKEMMAHEEAIEKEFE